MQQTLQKREKNFFHKLNTFFVLDNKLFWKTVKLFVSNKRTHQGKLKLTEGDKLLQDDSAVAEELNNFFKEAVTTFDVNRNSYIINPDSINISDPIEKAISKYKFHPSILLINDNIVNQVSFPLNQYLNYTSKKKFNLLSQKGNY